LPQNRAVKASGTDLPFADRSFDYVICIEVLEHLPPELRARIVSEMCRVCRKEVVITHPYGKVARWGDRFLRIVYTSLKPLHQQVPWWLVEHLQNPFPEPRDYLSGVPDGFRILRKGQENALVHPGMIFFTHLKVVSRQIAKSYTRRPDVWRRLAKLIHMPPYCRVMVILKRVPS